MPGVGNARTSVTQALHGLNVDAITVPNAGMQSEAGRRAAFTQEVRRAAARLAGLAIRLDHGFTPASDADRARLLVAAYGTRLLSLTGGVYTHYNGGWYPTQALASDEQTAKCALDLLEQTSHHFQRLIKWLAGQNALE